MARLAETLPGGGVVVDILNEAPKRGGRGAGVYIDPGGQAQLRASRRVVLDGIKRIHPGEACQLAGWAWMARCLFCDMVVVVKREACVTRLRLQPIPWCARLLPELALVCWPAGWLIQLQPSIRGGECLFMVSAAAARLHPTSCYTPPFYLAASGMRVMALQT